MSTDNSPISIAPTVEPGVRRYSPSALPVGATLIDGSDDCRARTWAAESQIGSLCRYSCRSIWTIVVSRVIVLIQ